MSIDQLSKAREIFVSCLRCDSREDRQRLAREQSAGNETLAREVLKLLEAFESSESFLEISPVRRSEYSNGADILRETLDSEPAGSTRKQESHDRTPSLKPGTQIGPYKIREKIAEGGMGAVYVAEQIKPVQRKVALKVIRPGMAGPSVVARFEAERQALAMMDHPNIARVLDGGATEDELPYFVMELVQGLPITEYCDSKKLSTRERLKLFIDVCRAIQHAHQKGIIHRDLKPSNILVAQIDGAAVPKVIDFGVAKALHQKLTDQTVYTQFAQMVGTPLYMSPEQADLGVIDVDTRSDVYSLGVVLYELLTGETPFNRERLKNATFDEMRRIIREEEPKRPSAMVSTLKAEAQSTIADRRGVDARKLQDALSGELDWLVMKALDKDRGRRYESASDLAADIGRKLRNEPIEAGPPSTLYRAKKFVQRHRVPLLVGSAVGLIILFVLTFAVNAKLKQISEYRQLVADFEASITNATASLNDRDLVAAERSLAQVRGRLGDADHVQLRARLQKLEAKLKDCRQQLQQLGRYRELAKNALGIDSGKTLQAESKDLAEIQEAFDIYSILDDDKWHTRLKQTCLSAQEQNEVTELAYRLLVAWSDNHVRWSRGHNPKSARESLEFLRRAELLREPTRAFYFVRSECYKLLKDTEQMTRDLAAFKEAEAASAFDHFLPAHTAGWRGRRKEAIEGYKAALLMEPDNYAALFFLAYHHKDSNPRAAAEIFRACLALRPDAYSALVNRASCLRRLQEYDEALVLMENAIVHENHTASLYGNRGDIHLDAHRNKEALADFTKGAAIESDKEHPDLELLAGFHRHRAEALERLGARDECEAAINSAIEILTDESTSEELIRCYSKRAQLHALAGERGRAFADADTAKQLIQAMGSDASQKCVAYSHNALAWGMVNSANLSLRNDPRAIEEAKLVVAAMPKVSGGWNTLGVAHYRAGDFETAIESLETSRKLDDVEDSEDGCLDNLFLAMAHHRLGKTEKAREYYDDALTWREGHGSNAELDGFFGEAEKLLGSDSDKSRPDDQERP